MERGTGVAVRGAREEDLQAIRDIFDVVYGGDYPHREFLDDTWLKRSIFSDDILMLIAENEADGHILGTASVVLDTGAHSDLIGEFGRLAVHPDGRGRGVGGLLMRRRIELVEDRLHVGIVENRCVHPFSQKISHAHGFAPVGFLPHKLLFGERESIALFCRHFGQALELRCNHPHIVPEVQPLAHLSLGNCGLPCDPIVDETAPGYPRGDDFVTEDLAADGLPGLMRIERGRVRRREVFGPMRLHYGFFKLTARRATYLVARRTTATGEPGSVAAALGYMLDNVEKVVRVFELIVQTEHAIRVLFEELLRRCRDEWGTAYVELDVGANATRLQRTLIELGFLPVAYVPAMAFHDVERVDVVTMARLFVPSRLGKTELVPGAQAYADQVMRAFRRQQVLPQIAQVVHRLPLLEELTYEQAQRVAGACGVARFAAGQSLFDIGEAPEAMFVLLEGSARIQLGVPPQDVGRVGPGELAGELSLLTGEPHSARAVAHEPVTAATLSREDIAELNRRRPDIGILLYRHLAVSLGRKLQQMDSNVIQLPRA
ncbi:MAG: cyclic nucleotide-binding domain-containing protein [bacterium]|nr:cyclic nucleotide-binding domain-containing protein [bacterium]